MKFKKICSILLGILLLGQTGKGTSDSTDTKIDQKVNVKRANDEMNDDDIGFCNNLFSTYVMYLDENDTRLITYARGLNTSGGINVMTNSI